MPDNGNYLLAAYVVAGVILVWYGCGLWRNSGKGGKGNG